MVAGASFFVSVWMRTWNLKSKGVSPPYVERNRRRKALSAERLLTGLRPFVQ